MWWGTVKDATGNDTCLRYVSILLSHLSLIPSISYSWPLIMTSVSLKMVGKPGALYELLGVCFVLTCWSYPTSMLNFANSLVPWVLRRDPPMYGHPQLYPTILPRPYIYPLFLHLLPRSVSYGKCLYPCHYKPTYTPIYLWRSEEAGGGLFSLNPQYLPLILFKKKSFLIKLMFWVWWSW